MYANISNMGRPSKRLNAAHIERLKAYRRQRSPTGRSYSYAEMKLTMQAPCNWQTLQRAIEGKPIWEPTYEYIVRWLELHMPAKPGPAVRDYKSAAAGDRDEPNGEPAAPGEGAAPGKGAPERLRSEKVEGDQ
jgi:hypothetical protein